MAWWRRSKGMRTAPRTAVATALAVALAGLTTVGSVTTAVPPAAAEGDVVVSTDFEDGTWDPWTQNGGPTLSVVDVAGGKALSVAGRTNDYDGVKSPAGLLEPGVRYTFSMRARLADGTTPGEVGVRFVAEPSYTWIGNTTMTTEWTTVEGSFTTPEDGDPQTLRVYLGTGDIGSPYTYLVDDIVITRPRPTEEWEPTPDPGFVPGGAVNPSETPRAAARGTGKVAALTFDDGPNPGETDRLLDVLAANDVTATFCVIGQNVEASGGAELLRRIVEEGHTLCNHGTTYADMGGLDPHPGGDRPEGEPTDHP